MGILVVSFFIFLMQKMTFDLKLLYVKICISMLAGVFLAIFLVLIPNFDFKRIKTLNNHLI